MKISFTTIARGDDSAYGAPARLLIPHHARWEAVWRRHVSDLSPPPPIPKIDFDREAVLAVFSEEERTAGHRVEIVAVEQQGSVLIVKIRQRQAGRAAQDVITRPFHIVRVDTVGVGEASFRIV